MSGRPTVLTVSRWSLRARLVVGMLALLAVMGVVIGVVSVVALDTLPDRTASTSRWSPRSLRSTTVHEPASRWRRPAGQRRRQTATTTGSATDRSSPAPSGSGVGTIGAQVVRRDGRGRLVGSNGRIQQISDTASPRLTDGPRRRAARTRGTSEATWATTASSRPRPRTATTVVTGAAARRRARRPSSGSRRDHVGDAARAGARRARSAWPSSGSTLRPLRRVAATAGRVAELPLDRGEVALAVRVPEADTDPRTEVGQVGAALNRMLDHVGAALTARQASETRVRQFVADASHELRTPLASIRGYAELTRPRREDRAARHRARPRPGRVRERPDDRSRRGPAAARPPGLRPTARPRPVDLTQVAGRRGQRRPRGRPRPPLGARPAGRAGHRLRRRGPAAPGGRPTCWRTPVPTPRPAPPVVVRLTTDAGQRRPDRGGQRAGHPPGPAARRLRALRPR